SVGPQVDGKVITGTVTYNFFNNADCSGTPAFTETVALGTQSTTEGPLAAGNWAFDAQYNGDSNYAASAVSSCENFVVGTSTPTTTTNLHNAAGGTITVGDTIALGSSVYDTSSVGPQVDGKVITGTVTYN